jgi:N-acetyl-anhydromuramyl-L-alanine amidase AmpD
MVFINITGDKMKRILSKKEWRRRKLIRKIIGISAVLALMFVIIIFSAYLIFMILKDRGLISNAGRETITETLSGGELIRLEYLTPNPYSRPQTKLKNVKGIVVHYTANPGTSAENNRSYFEGLANKKTTSASSHFIIGLEGEIIQCIPLNEVSFASNNRNNDTISIECCHPDETGKFNDETYTSLVALTAELCIEFDLNEEDIIRHYDITGKICPKYYVEHEDAWQTFKIDVVDEIQKIQEDAAKEELTY